MNRKTAASLLPQSQQAEAPGAGEQMIVCRCATTTLWHLRRVRVGRTYTRTLCGAWPLEDTPGQRRLADFSIRWADERLCCKRCAQLIAGLHASIALLDADRANPGAGMAAPGPGPEGGHV